MIIILNLSSNSPNDKIIYELVDKYKNNLEWTSILEKSLDNLNSSEYANLLSSINGKELSSEEKENLEDIEIVSDIFKDKIFVAELNLTKIFNNKVRGIKVKEISKYPSISIDLAFVVNKDVNYEDVKNSIKKACSREKLRAATS